MNRPPDSNPQVLRQLLKSMQRAKEKVDSYGIKVESEENPCKRVMSRANFQGIKDEINKVDWDSTLNRLGIEEAYSRFLGV